MPALIERPKMTIVTYQALKRHIMREREKKKQEQEQDALNERLRKERELRKKKQEEDSMTLEQTKEQILQLEQKYETLKQEKHELFSQLKKVLHQEDETRRRAQMKEQNELLSFQHAYPQAIAVPSHPILLHPGVTGRPTMYKHPQTLIPIQQRLHQGIKRPRSPSPPPVTVYQTYPGDHKYTPSSFTLTKQQGGVVYTPQQAEYKPSNYPQSQPTAVYTSQPSHTYQQQAGPYAGPPPVTSSTKYTPTTQSAFTSYPGHFAQQQKQMGEAYPHGYPLQRIQQAGYLSSTHGAGIPLQQQLEHANQKSGFSEDKYKLQQQPHIRGIAPMASQQTGLIPQTLQLQQAPQSKGSIVTGYSGRGQQPQAAPPTNSYQPSAYQGQQTASGRPQTYSAQQAGRYY